MKIIDCNATNETGERLCNLMPDNLKDINLIINIGNSQFQDTNSLYANYEVINKTEAIKRAVNKKEMFEIFSSNRINSLKYIDIETRRGKIFAKMMLVCRRDIVLRGERGLLKLITLKDFEEIDNPKWKYVTLKEDKILEYRAIVFKGEIIRMMVKINSNGNFKLKQINSKFEDINLEKLDNKVKENITNSVNCLGLDLAGVDILVNKHNQYKIIEVNSGMALCSKSIKLIYDIIQKLYIK